MTSEEIAAGVYANLSQYHNTYEFVVYGVTYTVSGFTPGQALDMLCDALVQRGVLNERGWTTGRHFVHLPYWHPRCNEMPIAHRGLRGKEYVIYQEIKEWYEQVLKDDRKTERQRRKREREIKQWRIATKQLKAVRTFLRKSSREVSPSQSVESEQEQTSLSLCQV